MKLGIITDIHNNLLALIAAMERLNQLECDKIICCGDIIGIGPYPEETVQFMMCIPNLIAVRGNHEKYLLERMPNIYPNDENMSIEEMKHHKWEHSLLSKESIDFLQGLPYRFDTVIDGYTLSVMHYCMDDDNHYNYTEYNVNPTENDLNRMFNNVKSDIILHGHNHNRNICRGDKFYINVGSLGCPASDKNISRAGVLTIEQKNIFVESIDVDYNSNDVVARIDELKYPGYNNIKKYFYGIL